MRISRSMTTAVKNEKGLAMIETLPLLVIFIVLLSFTLGLFGVVHTAIMNSMAARTYAFETFRNRADLTLFRDRKSENVLLSHEKIGNRFHTIDSEKKIGRGLGEGQFATTRPLAFGERNPSNEGNQTDHNSKIYDISGRNRTGVRASPAWVMVGYGICVNARCGD